MVNTANTIQTAGNRAYGILAQSMAGAAATAGLALLLWEAGGLALPLSLAAGPAPEELAATLP